MINPSVLVPAALRYLRTQIGQKDEFYSRHLIKNHAFGPIVDLFLSVKDRNNLINSACLELFELIGKVRLQRVWHSIYDADLTNFIS